MTRDEALDLLPLLAGGELDEVTAAAAQRAAEEDPALLAELESYRALDAALTTAYAPEPASTALAVAPQLVVVRRRCPYCHDAIEAEALVVCAACATPHHAPCFEANEGCSLLGCGSSASIAASGPASVVCSGCAQSTPQGAPFCAWCGADLAVEATPRHARPREPAPFDWRRYAAAAALLLAATFGGGSMFGLQQVTFLENGEAGARVVAQRRAMDHAEQLCETLLALQQVHLAERGRYAVSLDELRALRPWQGPGQPAEDVVVRLLQRMETGVHWTKEFFDLTFLAQGGDMVPRHRIVLRSRDRSRGSLVADERSAIWSVWEPFQIDPEELELLCTAPLSSRTAVVPEWRSSWTPR